MKTAQQTDITKTNGDTGGCGGISGINLPGLKSPLRGICFLWGASERKGQPGLRAKPPISTMKK